MNRSLQPLLLVLTGAAVLRVSFFSDMCLRYVKEGLQPFLVVSGFALAAVGLIGVLCDKGRPGTDHGHDHDHGHDRVDGHDQDHDQDHVDGPRVAWLLLPPALLLLLFAPPALGSYTAARDNPQIVADYDHFEPLPAGTAPLSLTEFIARVQQDGERSLEGHPVLLSGFVTPGKDGTKDGTWDLTRLLVACCAADSRPLTVTVRGVEAPPADTWVRVTGTWHPAGVLGTTSAALALDATSLQRVPEPRSPYRDRAPSLSED